MGLEAVGGKVLDFAGARARREARADEVNEPWRSKREIAGLLGVSTRTVENYMRAGLPFSKPLVNGRVSFKVSEVDAWMRRRDPAA